MTAPAVATAPPRRRRSAALQMRTLPGTSPLHRVWAGTKLIAVVAIVLVSLVVPTWRSVVLVAVLAAAGAVAARVPRSALPRPPIWLGVFIVLAGAVSALGNGLGAYAVSMSLAFVLLALSVLVVWTTPLSQVAPTVAALASPLRRFGAPVDEWAVTCALCVRSLPLLRDEFRVLLAARRLRRRPDVRRRSLASLRTRAADLVDLTTTFLSVSLRRAVDAATAIEVRGGVPAAGAARPRLGLGDLVVALATVVLCVVALVP